jgi:hypothetical protein
MKMVKSGTQKYIGFETAMTRLNRDIEEVGSKIT